MLITDKNKLNLKHFKIIILKTKTIIFVIGYCVLAIYMYSSGGGPDEFGYVFTDTNLALEPDAPLRPSDEAKEIAESDPSNIECVQNANTQSYFRCLTIAGSPSSCRIGASIGSVQACPTSEVFSIAFDSSIDACLRINLAPDPNNPFFGPPPTGFFGPSGFGFTFYGTVVTNINICPLGFITLNAEETFTGVNFITRDPNALPEPTLIEKNFPNIDDLNTADEFEGFPATIAAYYTFLDSTPDISVGGSGVYLQRGETDFGPNNTLEFFIIEYNNVIDSEGNRSTFQIVLFGRIFDVTDPQNPIVIDEVDLIVVKYERAVSDESTFRLAGINEGTLAGLTWNSGIFDVFDAAVAYIISLSPAPVELFVNDRIRGAQSGFKGNPVTLTTFFPVVSAVFEGRRCERAFAAKVQFSTDPQFSNIICTSDVITLSVEVPRFIRTTNINPSPCQGQIAFKPFVQYFWRIVLWKHEYPQDVDGNCDFTAQPAEPDRTLYTATRITAQAKPDSFIICNTCKQSGTGQTLGLPGGNEGGARSVIGSFTGQGTAGSPGGSCAIASASLDNTNKLNFFKHVRNEYIAKSKFGLQFLKSYYKHSNHLSNLVKNNNLLKLPFKFTVQMLYSYISFTHQAPVSLQLFWVIILLLLLTFLLVRKTPGKNLSD